MTNWVGNVATPHAGKLSCLLLKNGLPVVAWQACPRGATTGRPNPEARFLISRSGWRFPDLPLAHEHAVGFACSVG